MLGELRTSMWGTSCKLSPWLVRGGTRYNLSSNLRAFPITFVTSECLRELSSIAFSMIFKALVVIIETGFKLGFTATEVMLGVVIRC